MNVIKEIEKLNEKELTIGDGKSWHDVYQDSAYIFIGGLNYRLTEGDILTVFSQYGEPTDVNLVRDRDTGKSKGFCFLAYEDQRSTRLAVDNFNGAELAGRKLRVDHCGNYEDPEVRRLKRLEKGLKVDEEDANTSQVDAKTLLLKQLTGQAAIEEEARRKAERKAAKKAKKAEKKSKRKHKHRKPDHREEDDAYNDHADKDHVHKHGEDAEFDAAKVDAPNAKADNIDSERWQHDKYRQRHGHDADGASSQRRGRERDDDRYSQRDRDRGRDGHRGDRYARRDRYNDRDRDRSRRHDSGGRSSRDNDRHRDDRRRDE
eukprot:TRINITY_DN4541_c0_g1_i1.p1 TRINITY_DN4541_c0_g1~~TRINITY_DN4541_c0_g1_i1.p1  ORF type:complete len:318 (+),score=80.78 TRINITY_DN4541_c0_g1_i1:111-1064(+)